MRRAAALLLGLLCLLVYNANLRWIGAGDTFPARYLPLGIWRHGTLEVLLLQASPLLGAAFGGGASALGLGRLATLAAGSVLLTAHVFVFNDWAGRHGDLNDPHRARRVFARHGIGSGTVAAIACLGILYSDTEADGKGVPVLASLIHLVGGALHFLLGYTVARPIDLSGLAISLFFGLVFAGGHLNQEVRDRDADLRNGIRTTAVVLGPRRALLASLAAFSAALGELALLAVRGVVPRPVLWAVALLWPVQVVWTLRALRGEPGSEEARWLQRRYRFLYAVLGVVMVSSLVR
jgi:4-hydroxybenzoate polyprenyltransferase